MLLSSAFLQINFFIESPIGYKFGLQAITDAQASGEEAVFESTLQAYNQTWAEDLTPLINIICGDYQWT